MIEGKAAKRPKIFVKQLFTHKWEYGMFTDHDPEARLQIIISWHDYRS
jgi:hypothetical protein